MTHRHRILFFAFLSCFSFLLPGAANAKWKYFRTGKEADKVVQPRGGFALMGGGGKLEPAFRFLCERADGGDFLILRANT